ncbi:MAG: hypothetical protein HYZ25_03805 [Chloroflexi bacterium]|nr:hypothetical protein [Chloroflexota bacterium]
MPTDLKITTAMLYQGALLFALLDAVCVPLLLWRIRREAFARLKWELVLSAALVWFGIWSWAIGNFWDTVYVYVFPAWARIGVPPLAFGIAGLVALGLWAAAMRFRGQPVLIYFLCGAALGSLSHAWALTRGLMTRPPMLQGASPLGALILAFFEYLLYWCVILTLAAFLHWIYTNLHKNPTTSGQV